MEFLGHPHVLTDRVAHGKKLGTTLGFPTVNLRFPDGGAGARPRGVRHPGVVWDGASRPAVTNIGVRPTVDDGNGVSVEGYILDFSGDLYGQTIRMEFFQRACGGAEVPILEALRAEVMQRKREIILRIRGKKSIWALMDR